MTHDLARCSSAPRVTRKEERFMLVAVKRHKSSRARYHAEAVTDIQAPRSPGARGSGVAAPVHSGCKEASNDFHL